MRSQPSRPDHVVVATQTCIVCGHGGVVEMPQESYRRWAQDREFIQAAWPEGTAAEREQLINGTHGECFTKLFGEDA